MYVPLVIGMWEWIAIGLAIVLFFGAAKLPKLGKGLGEGIRNFKKGIKGELDDDGKPIAAAEDSADDQQITDAATTDSENDSKASSQSST